MGGMNVVNFTGGVFMVDGQEICEISGGEIEFYDPPQEEQGFKLCSSAEITCATHIRPKMFYMLLAGVHISNNYLKMHGGIMERKVQHRKIRRKHHG